MIKKIITILFVIVFGAVVGIGVRLLLETDEVGHYFRDDVRGSAEFAMPDGKIFTLLPTIIEHEKQLTEVGDLLAKYKIAYAVDEQKIMVAPEQLPLALELLQVAGLAPDAQHFSFTEVTAPPATLRYELQQQLATQNMVANMLTLLADEIVSAQVNIAPTTKIAQVKIKLSGEPKTLPDSVIDEIKSHLQAVFSEVQEMNIVFE